jgi:hypothetical protein
MRKRSVFGLLFLFFSLAIGTVACGGLLSPDEDGGPEGTGDDNNSGENLVYEYHREGGIAGFCDVVMVYANGDATIASCATEPPQIIHTTRLSDEQLAMVQRWVENLAPFDTEQKDDAVADAMTIQVEFHGEGDGEATAADVQAMQDLAVELLRQPVTQ